MSAQRYLRLIGATVLVSGCGTMDSLHYVKGQAPSSSACEVVVSESGGTHVKAQDTVSGSFAVSYTAGGPFPSKVDVAAYCNGIKVKELKGISPRSAGDTDLGTLAP
jgi:hypothetical protein